MATGLYSSPDMTPDIGKSISDAVIGRNSCETAVNAVATGISFAGNAVMPVAGQMAAGLVTYVVGEGVKAAVCQDDTPTAKPAAVGAPIDIKPSPNAPVPPPVRHRAASGPACPVSSGARGGTCGLY